MRNNPAQLGKDYCSLIRRIYAARQLPKILRAPAFVFFRQLGQRFLQIMRQHNSNRIEVNYSNL